MNAGDPISEQRSPGPVIPDSIDGLAVLLQDEMNSTVSEILQDRYVLEEARPYFTGNGSSPDPTPLYDDLVGRACRPVQAYMKGAAFASSTHLLEAARLSPETSNGDGMTHRQFSVTISYRDKPFGQLHIDVPYDRTALRIGGITVRGIAPGSEQYDPRSQQ